MCLCIPFIPVSANFQLFNTLKTYMRLNYKGGDFFAIIIKAIFPLRPQKSRNKTTVLLQLLQQHSNCGYSHWHKRKI